MEITQKEAFLALETVHGYSDSSLDTLRQYIKQQEPKGQWRAEKEEAYYSVDSHGRIHKHFERNKIEDSERWLRGNYSKTYKKGRNNDLKTLAKQRVINKIYELSTKDVEWHNIAQNKYFVFYSHHTCTFEIGLHTIYRYSPKEEYSTDKSAIKWIIDNMDSDLQIIWDTKYNETKRN